MRYIHSIYFLCFVAIFTSIVNAEVFLTADRPIIQHDTNFDIKWFKPWNYDKSWNAGRYYPLVLALHGYPGQHYFPCFASGSNQQRRDFEMSNYPCFFLSPTVSNADWGGGSGSWVRDHIETMIQTCRIDTNRIYLMGISMGGSGGYSLMKSCYTEHGRIFAAMIRNAGPSQTNLPDVLASNVSIWYNVGLADSTLSKTIAEDSYQFIKGLAYNGTAVETAMTDTVITNVDTLGVTSRYTRTLTKNNVEIMKKSEYTGVTHVQSAEVPFYDTNMLAWLFSQSLATRNGTSPAAPPIVTITPGSIVTNRSFTATLDVDRDFGYWSTNGSPFVPFDTNGTSVPVNGTTTLRCFGSNAAGAAAIILRTYSFDNSAPMVSGAPQSFSTNKPFSISLAATENSGYISVNGGAFTPFGTAGTNLYIAATTTLSWFGKDVLGNASITNTAVYTITTILSLENARYVKNTAGIVFIELPENTTGAVYSVSGRHIASLAPDGHGLVWNHMAANGHRAAPGVYLCKLTTSSENKVIKIIVTQ